MKVLIAQEDASSEALIPPARADASGIGVNYADAWLKVLKKVTLEDGRKLSCRRRGLKLTLKVGSQKGEGLMRRMTHGPDVKVILAEALAEAAADVGVSITVEDGGIYFEEPPASTH